MSAPDPYEGAAVLVTGADGFIGSHLAEALARRGARVTAIALYNSFDAQGWLDDVDAAVLGRMRVLRGDVRDPAFLRAALRGQDVVFHLAALIAIPHSYVAAQSYVDTNVLGTLHLLEAAREHAPRRVVHTSTSEVYGTARSVPIGEDHPLQGQSPYAATKIGADMLAESYALSHDLPVAILRPFNTFGPRQSERAVIPTLMRQALDPRAAEIRVGDLTPIRDFTYVADTVEAFLAMGASDGVRFGQPYNAGTGQAVTMAELAALVQEAAGTRKPIRQDEGRLRPPRSEVRELRADPSRLAAATGWRARVPLREGLERTARWWRARLAEGRVRRGLAYAT